MCALQALIVIIIIINKLPIAKTNGASKLEKGLKFQLLKGRHIIPQNP